MTRRGDHTPAEQSYRVAPATRDSISSQAVQANKGFRYATDHPTAPVLVAITAYSPLESYGTTWFGLRGTDIMSCPAVEERTRKRYSWGAEVDQKGRSARK